MEDFLAFLQANWRFLIEIFLSFVVLCLALFKKKTKITIPDDIWTELPRIINEAEALYGAGAGKDKIQYVLGKFVTYLNKAYDLTDFELKQLSSRIVDQIEQILSTPTKKGE